MVVAIVERVIALDAAIGDDGGELLSGAPFRLQHQDLHLLDGEIGQVAAFDAGRLRGGAARIGPGHHTQPGSSDGRTQETLSNPRPGSAAPALL